MRPLGNCDVSAIIAHSTPSTFLRSGVTHLLAARLARVLVAVACIFQLGTALEVLENQLVGSATHDGPKSCIRLCGG